MLRELAWRVAPAYMADRSVRFTMDLRAERGITERAERFIAAHGDAVQGGPFAGLRYWATGDAPIPKLLGCYEAEILPWIAAAASAHPTRFVDIGAADGYYAVGFARMGVPVEPFELSRVAREQCEELAARNGVSLDVRGGATAENLAALPLDRAFVLSDCEGAEADVFTPQAVIALRTATLVIELHEQARPGVTELLRARFAGTHTFEVVGVAERDPDAYPALDVLAPGERAEALSEMRQDDHAWARCLPLERR